MGLEVGVWVKFEIQMYESWMRLLLLASEIERFKNAACCMRPSLEICTVFKYTYK